MFTNVETQDVVEAMEVSDHSFEVELVPLYMPDGKMVPNKRATVRADTGAYLGTVGNAYQPLQPAMLYSMASELIQATAGKIIKTLTMEHGAVIGIIFELDQIEYVRGDVISKEFLMLLAFNMKYSILGRATTNRFFCMNQLASSRKLFNIKNTKYNASRLNIAMKLLSHYGSEMKGFDARMKLLTQYRMNEDAQIEWFRSLLPVPKKDSTRSESRFENQVIEYRDLLHNGLGTDHPGVKGTGYHALQALTEFCNHHRSTRVKDGRSAEEVRFESVTFGSSNNLMQTGFEGLIAIASGNLGYRLT